MVKKCIQCGKEFEISTGEQSFYEGKGLEIPKRCRSCRKSNRIKENPAVVKRGSIIGRRRGTGTGAMRGNTFTGLVAILIIAVVVIFGGVMRGNSTRDSHTNPNVVSGGNTSAQQESTLVFRNFDLLNEHYQKHGKEMGYSSAEEYLQAANDVINHPDVLHKTEKEDGDDVYYLEATKGFVVVSTDGYIRTYFQPEDGILYFNRQ